MSRAHRWAGPALAGTLIVVLGVGTALLRSGGRSADGPEPEPVFPELLELRAAVADCTEELEAEQARFRDHERAVDSLRAAVFAYESEERTVPAGQFDAYLDIFTAYNESVRAWHERAEALQATWEECRDLTERHNAVVDSLSGNAPAEPPLGVR